MKLLITDIFGRREKVEDGTIICFVNLLLKSIALSYTPDSEQILEIAMCSKNKQSSYEVFH